MSSGILPALSKRSTLLQADIAEPPSFFNAWEQSCIKPGVSLADREKAECDLWWEWSVKKGKKMCYCHLVASSDVNNTTTIIIIISLFNSLTSRGHHRTDETVCVAANSNISNFSGCNCDVVFTQRPGCCWMELEAWSELDWGRWRSAFCSRAQSRSYSALISAKVFLLLIIWHRQGWGLALHTALILHHNLKTRCFCFLNIQFYFLHNSFGQLLDEFSSVLPQIVCLILLLLINKHKQERYLASHTHTHTHSKLIINLHICCTHLLYFGMLSQISEKKMFSNVHILEKGSLFGSVNGYMNERQDLTNHTNSTEHYSLYAAPALEAFQKNTIYD